MEKYIMLGGEQNASAHWLSVYLGAEKANMFCT